MTYFAGRLHSFASKRKGRGCRSRNRQWKNSCICNSNAGNFTGNVKNGLVKIHSQNVIQKLRLQNRPEKWKACEVGAIVISPTRELAAQISDVVDKFLQNIPELTQVLIMGGDKCKVEEDMKKLQKGANIIIATPGRLNGILNECKDVNMKRVKNLLLEDLQKSIDEHYSGDVKHHVKQLVSHNLKMQCKGTIQPKKKAHKRDADKLQELAAEFDTEHLQKEIEQIVSKNLQEKMKQRVACDLPKQVKGLVIIAISYIFVIVR